MVSTPEADPAYNVATGSDVPTWWPHPDGYEMVLPAGWRGIAIEDEGTEDIVDAVIAANPELTEPIAEVVDASDLRISAIATSETIEGKVAPLMLVLAEPKAGRKWYAVKEDARERLGDLPGLDGRMTSNEYRLPSAEGIRYDYVILDEHLGEIFVRSWLFKFGPWVYIVNFVVSADLANDAGVDFDSIQDSLRFGA